MWEFYHQQLSITYFVQKIRTPFLDTFFSALNYLDTEIYYTGIAVAALFLVNRKEGMRFFGVLIILSFFNYYLKTVFHHPRPFILDPHVGIAPTESPYGLPSGGATCGVAIGYFLWRWLRGIPGILLGLGYAGILSFSRIYLGVHFLTDVIAGWVIAGTTLGVYNYFFPSLFQFFQKIPRIYALGTTLLLFTLLMLPFADNTRDFFITLSWGLFLGAWYIDTFTPHNVGNEPLSHRIPLFLLGLAGLWVFTASDNYFKSTPFVGNLLAGLWVGGGAYWAWHFTHTFFKRKKSKGGV